MARSMRSSRRRRHPGRLRTAFVKKSRASSRRHRESMRRWSAAKAVWIASRIVSNSTTRRPYEIRRSRLSRNRRDCLLKPSNAAEAPVQTRAGGQHQSHHDEITVLQLQFGNVLEIHAVDSGHRGWNSNDGE